MNEHYEKINLGGFIERWDRSPISRKVAAELKRAFKNWLAQYDMRYMVDITGVLIPPLPDNQGAEEARRQSRPDDVT